MCWTVRWIDREGNCLRRSYWSFDEARCWYEQLRYWGLRAEIEEEMD